MAQKSPDRRWEQAQHLSDQKGLWVSNQKGLWVSDQKGMRSP